MISPGSSSETISSPHRAAKAEERGRRLSAAPDASSSQGRYEYNTLPSSAPHSEANEMATVLAFLRALRRRWKLALAAGIPVGMASAAIAWLTVPANYTAFALLRIAPSPEVLVFETSEPKRDFQTYRKTQIALIKSRFTLSTALRQPGISNLHIVQQREHPLEWLKRTLNVGSHHSPEILKISLTGQRPQELAALVNAVSNAYLKEVVNAQRKQRVQRLNKLEDTYHRVHEKELAKQSRVEKLAEKLGTGNSEALTIKQQMVHEDFAQLRREYMNVRFERMREEVRLAARRQQDEVKRIPPKKKKTPHAEKRQSPSRPDAYSQFARRRIAQLKTLIGRYEDRLVNQDTPALSKYRRELQQLQQRLDRRTNASKNDNAKPKNRLATLKRQEALLKKEVDKYADFADNIGTSSYQLEAKKQELQQVSRISDRVAREMEALRIELQSPPRVTRLQDADVPVKRDSARRYKMTGLAGCGGFGFLIGSIAIWELRKGRVASASEAAQIVGPLLGTVPTFSGGTHDKSHFAEWRVRYASPNAISAAIDNIRAILLQRAQQYRLQTIAIVSPAGEEGRTTLSCELSKSLALSGRRTLVLDCNVRAPSVHKYLRIPNTPGLSDYLCGDLLAETVVRETDIANLFAVAAGLCNEPASRDLSASGGKQLLNTLRESYSFLIVDTPPVLSTAEASAVAQNTDAVIMVVRQGATRRQLLESAVGQLRLLNVVILGTVVVDAPPDYDVYRNQSRTRVFRKARNGNT